MKMISKAAGAAVATLALIAGAGVAGPALAAHTTHSAPASQARAVKSAHAAPSVLYPGHPLIPATARTRQELASGRLQTTLTSDNWSGYVALKKGATFRYIQATFFVPYLNCPVSPGDPVTYSSHWVGFDGVRDGTVEQDGFEADCLGAKPTYHAWWELFPKPETPISLVVKGGDSITAIVFYSKTSKKFTLAIVNNTSGRHFSISLHCQVTCHRSSAEVISEAPTGVEGGKDVLLPLADYQAVSYTDIAITETSGKSGGMTAPAWTTYKINQTSVSNNNTLVARPTPVHADAFDSYWYLEQ